MDWNEAVDVWSIIFGAIDAPESPSDGHREAAELLLALEARGELDLLNGRITSQLRQLVGGDLTAAQQRGLARLAAMNGDTESAFKLLFGARKRAAEELGDGLPKRRSAKPERLWPGAPVVRLVEWAAGHGYDVELVEPAPAPDPDTAELTLAALAADHDGILTDVVHVAGGKEKFDWSLVAAPATSVTVYLLVPRARGWERVVLQFPYGAATEWSGVAKCRRPQSSCESWCPLFATRTCAKRESGIGWSYQESTPGHDRRTFHELPAWEKAKARERRENSENLYLAS